MILSTPQITADDGIRRAVDEERQLDASWADIVVALRLSLGRAEYAVREGQRKAVRRSQAG